MNQTPKPSVTSKVPYSGSAGSVGAGDRVTQTQPNSLHALYILRTGFPPIVIQYIWVTRSPRSTPLILLTFFGDRSDRN